ncbi:MAG: GNAT family N-acetyltransferase [Halobacteriovoraceae bacterium]|nr:GNAT family N-acetyltransferase [Halobacteriovoraceae bacterium]
METERLKIIYPEEKHIADIISFYKENSDFLKQWEPKRPLYFFKELYWRENISKMQNCNHKKFCLRVLLYLKENEQFLGIVNFIQTTQAKSSFRVGYKLGENFQGNGYMLEALSYLIDKIFNDGYDIDKIFGNCLKRNHKSLSLLKRLGFKETDKEVKVEIDGLIQNHIELALFKSLQI